MNFMFVCSQTSETIYTIILNFFTSFDEVLTPLGGPFFVSLQELEGNWVISLWHFVDPLLMTGFDYSPLVHKINLFISATPTEKIPRESRFSAGISGRSSLKDWISSWSTSINVQDDFKIVAGYTLWNIWKARCSPVFENTRFQVEGIVRMVNKDISEWNEHLRKNTSGDLHACRVREPRIFYGAWCILGVAENEEHAEAIASWEAIKWAKRNNSQKLHMEGDCLNVVLAINSNLGSVRWTNNPIIMDCKEMLGSFSSLV
ncbi:uncharacterized protein LOC113332987 isoform X2 [Papaver somniferum]|uniref:uncharacterized protein LOC113332987 isoform X2 n=1 Tax=Papaver somniferum TaxID=3469 RepID=UPI000E6F9970|nr:uncharacterized protein LOC113332987 isoform X2 [Papaver somniferum]